MDITTLLKQKDGLRGIIDGMKKPYDGVQVDVVLGIEARAGLFLRPLWRMPSVPASCPVRKPKETARGTRPHHL